MQFILRKLNLPIKKLSWLELKANWRQLIKVMFIGMVSWKILSLFTIGLWKGYRYYRSPRVDLKKIEM
jgi:hypothetical protein